MIVLNRLACFYGASCPCLRQQQLSGVSAFVAFFWLVSSLALADRLAPHRRWHLVLWAVWWCSLREPLVRQSLAGNTIHEAIKPRQRMVLDVAFVKPKRKLVNIAAKML